MTYPTQFSKNPAALALNTLYRAGYTRTDWVVQELITNNKMITELYNVLTVMMFFPN